MGLDDNDDTAVAGDIGDTYAYEEQQEREALMKTTFHPMKKWYNVQEELKEIYGCFPLFWRDLKEWEPYKQIQKRYLTDLDKETAAEVKQPEEENEKVKKKRSRKSRWGPEMPDPIVPEKQRKKKSRWSSTLAVPTLLTDMQKQMARMKKNLEEINGKLETVEHDAALKGEDMNRSPSPEPEYDPSGRHINTRLIRMKTKLQVEKQKLLDDLVRINPSIRHGEYMRQKVTRKIYIPYKEYPNYNFIGLIIGPRGNTQKRMEKETNSRIAIRGRGSVKEGSRGKKGLDDDDELHVLVTAERMEDLDKAAVQIQQLLLPCDDLQNDHKQKQLRELALINGTLREEDYCHICGEKGHRQWECPNREKSFKAVEVVCAICGDSSHPTSDCTQKEKSVEEKAALNTEYLNFMEQIGEKKAESQAAPVAPWLQQTTTTIRTGATLSAPGTEDAPAVVAPAAAATNVVAVDTTTQHQQQQYYAAQYTSYKIGRAHV